MKMLVMIALSALAALGPVPASAEPDQKRDQQRAFDELRNGRILPLRDIEARVLPSMRGAQYIGFDFDSESGISIESLPTSCSSSDLASHGLIGSQDGCSGADVFLRDGCFGSTDWTAGRLRLVRPGVVVAARRGCARAGTG